MTTRSMSNSKSNESKLKLESTDESNDESMTTNTILVRWNSKTFIFKPPHNQLRITKYGYDKLKLISNQLLSNQLTSGESNQSMNQFSTFDSTKLEFDKPWCPDPSDPLEKLRMIMRDQIESINCKTIGLTNEIQLDIDSLSTIDILKYQIIKLKYEELKNELRLTHRFPNWYYPMINFIKSIPEKLFIKIRLMDYFKRVKSIGYVISQFKSFHSILLDDNVKVKVNIKNNNVNSIDSPKTFNVISNSKLNNGIIGTTTDSNKQVHYCDQLNPIWTFGKTSRLTGGSLFKQTHPFINTGGGGKPHVLKPILDTSLLEDDLNYYLINCQTNSHFYDEHNSTLTWFDNLTVTILDSSQESNRIRQILKSNVV